MGGIKINIQGYDLAIAKLKKYPGDKGRAIKLILERAGFNIQNNARKLVTQRTIQSKNLHQQIQTQSTPDGATVFVKADYAPYVEFGTGELVNVPRGLEEYAMRFKGRGIRKVNLKARPFMYPAYRLERTVIQKKVREALRRVDAFTKNPTVFDK
jgi:HK97 gp10 family phage protein